MRVRLSRPALRRVCASVTVALAALGASAAAGAARPAVARTPSASALYYETQTRTGMLAIDRLDLSSPPAHTQVVGVGFGKTSVFGITLGGPYVFWTTQSGPRDRGSIMRASLSGGHVRRLVAGLASPDSIVSVGGFVYWDAQDAIGRVALNGSHLSRRYLVLPQEVGGGVADGLTAGGGHLYFTRCQDDTIGRADLSGRHVVQRFIALSPHSCPQGIAVANRRLYWTQLGTATIGRASDDGRHADSRWLHIRSRQGPFQVAADGSHVYWTWGFEGEGPSYTGRADINGTHLDIRFLFDSLYPMALAGRPAVAS